MKKRPIAFLAKALISGLLIGWLYSRTDLSGVPPLLAHARPLPVAGVFLLLFANTCISSCKWRLLLLNDGVRLPLRSLVASHLIGSFFNVFLPSNIGGDVYRIHDVAKRSELPVSSFASVFADRFTGFLALSVLGVVFPLAHWSLVTSPAMHAAPFCLMAGLVALAWLLFHQKLLRAAMRWTRLERSPRAHRLADEFLGIVGAYGRNPALLCKAMAISFVFQFNAIVCVYLMAVALGFRAPFGLFCVFVPLVSIMEAMPVTIYGVGLRDAGYVLLFSQIGRPSAEALSLSLLYVFLTLVYTSSGGMLFVFRRGAARRRGRAP